MSPWLFNISMNEMSNGGMLVCRLHCCLQSEKNFRE